VQRDEEEEGWVPDRGQQLSSWLVPEA
jgi:hypothetical protein